jgi:glutamate 5-kinase
MRTTRCLLACVHFSLPSEAFSILRVQEIKFGDNDTLSAITSSMIHADYLFLLTDVDGLYTANPRKDPSAKHIEIVTSVSVIRSQGEIATIFGI